MKERTTIAEKMTRMIETLETLNHSILSNTTQLMINNVRIAEITDELFPYLEERVKECRSRDEDHRQTLLEAREFVDKIQKQTPLSKP